MHPGMHPVDEDLVRRLITAQFPQWAGLTVERFPSGGTVNAMYRLGDDLLPHEAGPGLYDRITGLCAEAGFTPRIAQHTVEWQTVCALVETGLGVSLAPAGIRRLRLKGVTFRGVGPGAARTRVAVAWRQDDPNPLVVRLLAAVGQEAPTAAPGATPPVRLRP
ncbi:LysR substrate-binding domain-containing protein [Streptomyces nodosus]|uniref:LysR family substrate-binding domain-containing protein n=1 Tax=Streptomyces nodosus TaxID=40318 RepID=UPI0036E44E43